MISYFCRMINIYVIITNNKQHREDIEKENN